MLIWPNLSFQKRKGLPLGLASLGACLENSGHNVKIIDAAAMDYNLRSVIKEVKRFDPDVLGISVPTHSVYDAFKIVVATKNFNPNCLTVFGGAHPSVLPEETLRECSLVDIIVRGEGEITFTELLEKYEKKGLQNLTDVKGISFRNNGNIIRNPDRPLIEDLDSLPSPAFHLLPIEKYKDFKKIPQLGVKEKVGFLTSCRGCPYNCIFCASCALWGKNWRSRSPQKVIEDISILRDKYGFKIIEFVDDNFAVDKNRTAKICEMIRKEDIDINWIFTTRTDMVDRELISTVKKSKCYLIGFGFESGVQKILDFLCKGFTIEDTLRAVKIAQSEKMCIVGNFIIGVPGETKDMINQTISFANKLDIDAVYFSFLTPFPGTRIYEYAKENNLLLSKDWSKYTAAQPVMKIPGLTSFQLYWLMLKAVLKAPRI